jgi:medium-chain acyl-[acyl-carrier-protein] hydrolase
LDDPTHPEEILERNTIRQELTTVQSSETDFQQRLKLSNLFLWLQDAAANHAASLGFGYDDLLKQDLAWVLSRIRVQFFDFPKMGEPVTVKTWPKGVQQKLFFMRDYQLSGADGQPFVSATSAYVLINTRTRRIAMPGVLDVPVPDNGGLSAIDEPLDKIALVENLSDCYTLTVGYSMVDIMGHVNNARYIDWISDCFSIAEHQAHCPAWLQINFLNEVKPGEAVRLLRGERPDQTNVYYITGMNQATRAKAFEAEMGWRRITPG